MNNLDQVRKDLNKALEEVSKKHGIDFTIGNISYDNNHFTTKLTGINSSGTGVKMTQELLDLKKNERYLGFKFGSIFDFEGDVFEITGYKPRARKRPIVAKSQKSGKTFVFPMSFIKDGLRK